MRCEICLEGNQNCCPQVRFSGVPPTNGAYCEYVAHPGWLVETVPDHITNNQIAMLEPLAAGAPFAAVLYEISGMRPTEFEAAVENRLHIRYGWMAAVASATSLFTLMTLLFFFLGTYLLYIIK